MPNDPLDREFMFCIDVLYFAAILSKKCSRTANSGFGYLPTIIKIKFPNFTPDFASRAYIKSIKRISRKLQKTKKKN